MNRLVDAMQEMLAFHAWDSTQCGMVYIKESWLFRNEYEFDSLGLRIEGNIWDLNFKLLDDRDQVIAEIARNSSI